MNNHNYCLYVHKNKINGKIYVGKTCLKPEYRWGKNGKKYFECPLFWKAIQKYGWNNFEHIILFTGMTSEEACEMEKYMIAEFNANNPDKGYNISSGGEGIDSDVIKKLWSENWFKEKAIAAMREAWKDEGKRKRRSEAAKQRWSNQEYKERVMRIVKDACKTPVVCLETGEVFDIMSDAERKYNINHSNICRAIRTGYRCGGYHWQYYNDVSAKA